MTRSIDVIVARPPRNAKIVAVVVDLAVAVDPVEAADRVRDAAESLRGAGLALVLLPSSTEVRTRRRRWWRRDKNRGGSQ